MTTFGGELRRLMAARGISLRKLAKEVPCNNGYLSRIANDHKPPSADLAARLDELLDAGGTLAALRKPATDRAAPREHSPGWLDLPLMELPDVSRRPADGEYVHSIRATSQALVKLDTLHGGDDIYPLALRVFRAANEKLAAGAYAPELERDLIAATGEAGEVAAWLAYDADRQNASRQVIHEALMLSRQAGDRDMELFELTHLAMQSVHLHRPAEALRVTTGVLDDGELAPRVAALFDIRRGRALAQLGNEGAAFDALGRARSTLADGITARDSYWTWWIDDAEVLWHMGMARAELGEWAAAVPFLAESAAQRATARRARYNDLVHLLNALVHVQDWPEVEPVMTEVAAVVGEVGSTRTTNLLRRITGRVAREDAPSTVADLAYELRDVLET